jgi:hypothetical protein
VGGIAWLSDQAPAGADAGADGGDAGDAGGGDAGDAGDAGSEGGAVVATGPENMVSQVVNLPVPGTYLLSWWDQARDPTSGLPVNSSGQSAAAVSYRVSVFDANWTPVVGFTGLPTQSDSSGSVWSKRNILKFSVPNAGTYHIAFAASVAGGSPGSVAIADPQLELGTASGLPSPYSDTGGQGGVTQYECPLTSADLRKAFVRDCDPDGTCFYDLQTPITINTQTLSSNGMSLAGKLAKGNYNFRHVDVALNIVGTGVIDCSQTGSPDCNGSGYLSYTLNDDGTNIGVLGFDRQYRRFDFGAANINDAKALTSERYLTTPLGSDDQQLINQFMKTELRGRPLDGTYTLRIYDTPALHFDHIQDIQVVLNYHYWSAIQAPQNAN